MSLTIRGASSSKIIVPIITNVTSVTIDSRRILGGSNSFNAARSSISTRTGSSRLGLLGGHLALPPSSSSSSSTSTSSRTLNPFKRSTQVRTMATFIPPTMKGVLVEKTGGVEVLDYKTDLPVPQPKEGQILVKNEFIGINFIDTYFRTGLYPSTKPEILGREAEGVVAAVGPNTTTSLAVGTKVVWMAGGAYAEYTAVPVENAFAIPSSLKPGIAAAALLQGLTAITLIDEAYAVQAGDWTLVHAAAGGMGQWLVQTIKAKGGKVVATASTEEKRALATRLGADVVVGYGRDEVLAAVKEATGGAGVAGVFDGVGKDTFDLSLEAVARKGTVASFGNASGAVEPFAIRRLSSKNAKVCRPSLFNYIATPDERNRYCTELFDMLVAGKVDVGVHKTYPLSDIKQAHTDLEGRKTTGKLLLDPSK